MPYPCNFKRFPTMALLALVAVGCEGTPTGMGFQDPDDGADVRASVLRNRTLSQADRFGFPAVTTAFVAASADKDAFNLAAPENDEAVFLATLTQTIMARYGLDQAGATGLADFVLPDIQPLGDLSGFPNGRRLEDDVLDTELNLIFGVFGPAVPALQSDGVGGNDVAFLGTFPYLADPHTS